MIFRLRLMVGGWLLALGSRVEPEYRHVRHTHADGSWHYTLEPW